MNTKYWRISSLILAAAIILLFFLPVSSFSGLGGYHAEKTLGTGATPDAFFLIGTDTSAFLVLESMYPPTVTNGAGASSVTHNSARLNGALTDDGLDTTNVTVFWGQSDGGTTPASWTNNASLGTKVIGTFYYDASGLSSYTLYYYRMYAENGAGSDWADSSANFTTYLGPPADFVLTDMGAISINATWTKGAASTYTMVRIKRDTGPADVTDGELFYYGDNTTAAMSGFSFDVSRYVGRAWSYAADNVTHSITYAEDSIGGEGMTEVANSIDSLVSFLNNAGIMAFLIVAFVLVVVIIKNHIVLNAIGAPVAIVYGLTLAGSEDVYSSLWVAGLAIGLLGFFFLFRIAMTAVSLSKKKGE